MLKDGSVVLTGGQVRRPLLYSRLIYVLPYYPALLLFVASRGPLHLTTNLTPLVTVYCCYSFVNQLWASDILIPSDSLSLTDVVPGHVLAAGWRIKKPVLARDVSRRPIRVFRIHLW